MTPRILIVVTNAGLITEGKPTGLWLEEFAVPYQQFVGSGFAVTVASPKGGTVPIDPRSKPTKEKAREWQDAIGVLEQTKRLSAVSAADFDAVYLPGGHGAMFDLADDPDLKRLLSEFDAADKLIAAVCHGPAGFVGARGKDGRPLVAGKTMTSFTDAEERAGNLAADMPFLLESKMRELGARFVTRPNYADHVEVDGKFITGQNPASSLSIAKAIIAACGR
jgi:putative intracellular protease/amidase